MSTSERAVELSGSESALVTAALFALAEWPFETASAKDLVSDEHKAEGQRLGESVSARWRALLGGQVFGTKARGGRPSSLRREPR